MKKMTIFVSTAGLILSVTLMLLLIAFLILDIRKKDLENQRIDNARSKALELILNGQKQGLYTVTSNSKYIRCDNCTGPACQGREFVFFVEVQDKTTNIPYTRTVFSDSDENLDPIDVTPQLAHPSP